MKVDGKVAIVTGGSSGLGLATTKKLLEEGVKVVLKEIKRLVREGIDLPLDTALKQEVLALKNHTHSYDFKEGLSAFSEKREPEFKGY